MTEFEKELQKIPRGKGYFQALAAMLAKKKNVRKDYSQLKADFKEFYGYELPSWTGNKESAERLGIVIKGKRE